jgi:lysophospholipase
MSVPMARSPQGGEGEWFRGAGGLRLRQAYWQVHDPSGSGSASRGTVFLSTGRSEPIEKYFEVIGDFLKRGFCVVAHDWRGQGLSARLLADRLKCHARSADEFTDDFQSLIDGFENRAPKPWIMVGHSMGAALNLASLRAGCDLFAGALFSNPMLRVKTNGPPLWAVQFQADWKVKHGHATDFVPELFEDPYDFNFETHALTHDRVRYENWREHLFACPHLGVGSPTWGWLNFALKLGESLIKDPAKALKRIKIPVTIVVSGDDRYMVKPFTKAFTKKLFAGRYVEVPGAEHEIMIEQDDLRDAFFAEFDALADSISPRASMPSEATTVESISA